MGGGYWTRILALGPDDRGEDPRPIATAHDEIGDLPARRDAGKGKDLARVAGGVSVLVGRGAAGIAERGGDRGGNGLGMGGEWRGQREQRGGQGELHGTTLLSMWAEHGISVRPFKLRPSPSPRGKPG